MNIVPTCEYLYSYKYYCLVAAKQSFAVQYIMDSVTRFCGSIYDSLQIRNSTLPVMLIAICTVMSYYGLYLIISKDAPDIRPDDSHTL